MGQSRPWHPLLVGPKVGLWPIRYVDARQWLSVRRTYADALRPWEPLWPADALSLKGYIRRCALYHRAQRAGRCYYFLVFCPERRRLYGGLALTDIERGAVQKGEIGYWISPAWQNQGLMQAALAQCCDFAFDILGLHRIEAACIPANLASRRVLEKCGFASEGLAPAYIQINGVWQDHILFSRINHACPPAWARWGGGI